MQAAERLTQLIEAQRERGRRWRERHPELARAKAREYAARKRATGWRPPAFSSVFYNARRGAQRYGLPNGDLAISQVARIVLLPCFACGIMPAGGMDHVRPLSKGGTNDLANVQPACLPCNRRKQATYAA